MVDVDTTCVTLRANVGDELREQKKGQKQDCKKQAWMHSTQKVGEVSSATWAPR